MLIFHDWNESRSGKETDVQIFLQFKAMKEYLIFLLDCSGHMFDEAVNAPEMDDSVLNPPATAANKKPTYMQVALRFVADTILSRCGATSPKFAASQALAQRISANVLAQQTESCRRPASGCRWRPTTRSASSSTAPCVPRPRRPAGRSLFPG